MQDAPIFIVGTERSGSNLLRLILNSHSRIAVPHPPHVVRYFEPLQARYGPLADERNFRRLVEDVVRLVRVHIYQWDVPLDVDAIAKEAQPRDVYGIYFALQELYRRSTGKARWGCKSTFMIDHVDAILARFPDAKLLWLVRDPRDVAVSSRKSVFSTFHPYYTARLWTKQQETGLRWQDTLPPERLRLVRYERLVAEPEAEVREICAFLGEGFEPAMLRHFETEEARKSASLQESWKETGRPIHGDSVGRWQGQLTEDEVRLVEAIARDPMRRLGYAPTHPDAELDAVRPGPLERARFWMGERRLWLASEARSAAKDKNVRRRWARGAYVSWLEAVRR